MESSYLACCSEGLGPDFSKLNFEISSGLLSVDTKDQYVWLSFLLILIFPVYWAVVSCQLYRPQENEDNPYHHEKGNKYTMYQAIAGMIGLFLGIFRFLGFMLAVGRQPRWEYLDQEGTHLVGYITMATGLTALMYCGCHWGFYNVFLAAEKKKPSNGGPRKAAVGKLGGCCIQSVLRRAGTVAVFLGYSLMSASQAGLLLTWLLWISMCF